GNAFRFSVAVPFERQFLGHAGTIARESALRERCRYGASVRRLRPGGRALSRLVLLLPSFDPRAGLGGRGLQMSEIRSAEAMAGLPLLVLVLIPKLKRRCAESSVRTGVLPDADMHRAFVKLIDRFPAAAG